MTFNLCIYLFLLFYIFFPLHKDQSAYTQIGMASYYSNALEGNPTASGEAYDSKNYTAAHKSLPFGTIVNVMNLDNGKEVRVKINDRGPFSQNRIIDLSYAAAKTLEMTRKGLVEVRIVVIEPASGYSVGDSVTIK